MKLRLFILTFIFFLTNSIAWAYTLPLPEYTIKEDEQGVNINNTPYTIEIYQSELSPEELISFYKENLAYEGFLLITEDKIANILLFSRPRTKDNLSLHIDYSQRDLTRFSISSWKGDLFKQVISLRDMTEDAPGRDLSGIPRYPGSIRISSMEYGSMKSVSYKTKASHRKEDIVSFYENQMPIHGWKRLAQDALANQAAAQMLQGGSVIGEGDLILFEKRDSFCGIVITSSSGCLAGCGQGGCSSEDNIVSILLFPKQWGK